MKVVFLGTPEFALKPLEAIMRSKHELLAVVSQPDRAKDRKGRLIPTPVSAFATSNGYKVFQFSSINREGESILKELNPDIMVTAAYGQILTERILSIPRYGIINVHASLLPLYRGASPIQTCLLNGDKQTGVTIMQTERGLDCGAILSQEAIDIAKYETAGELSARLSELGAKILIDVLDNYTSIKGKKQDETRVTKCAMIDKKDVKINWSESNNTVCNLIRAMNPSPIAFCEFVNENVKIYKAVLADEQGKVGEVLSAKKRLIVACGSGSVEILQLQLPGKKVVTASDFLLSGKIKTGDVFN